MKPLEKAITIAVRDCLGVKRHETVLVVTDDELKCLGTAFYEIAQEYAGEALLARMAQRQNHGQEPPAGIARLMLEADAIFMVTGKSLSHTQARKAATAKGARIASMPGATEAMVLRTMNADYGRIKRLGEKVARIVSGAKRVRITTALGTDLTLSLRGRASHPDTGIIHQPGGFTNLPAGEVYTAPLEGTAQGLLVIDGAIAEIWPIRRPIEVAIAGGYAVGMGPGREAGRLWEILSRHGRQAFNVAEFGIGINYKARLTGNILEDEKVLGTIHIAFGDNSTIGGRVRVPSHQDGIVTRPSVWIDGRQLMREGKLLV
jgi:leucyl aminopeptidase (aminopeptidase T)